MELKNRLRERRIEKGFTQTQLAEATGLKQGTLANYEKGKNVPSSIVLSKIATALDVTPGWLLDGGIKNTGRFIEQVLGIYQSESTFKEVVSDDVSFSRALTDLRSKVNSAAITRKLQLENKKLRKLNDELKNEIRNLQKKVILLLEEEKKGL